MTGGPDRPGHDRPPTGDGRDGCGGRTRGGGQCGLPAGWGTPHRGSGRCRKHGGNTPTHLARGRRVAAERAVQLFGLPVVTTPERALIDELNRTNGHVAWLAGKVAELEPAAAVWGERKSVIRQATEGEYEVTTESGAGVNIWLQLYQAERAHLIEVAKASIVSGAAVAAADGTADLARRFADVLDRASIGSGLDWAQRDTLLARFAAELAELDETDGDDG